MLNPANTTIVLIEFQNDFTSPGGVFYNAVKGVMQGNNMLANNIATVTVLALDSDSPSHSTSY
jgi:ureidoacrylate peracid hydrolase